MKKTVTALSKKYLTPEVIRNLVRDIAEDMSLANPSHWLWHRKNVKLVQPQTLGRLFSKGPHRHSGGAGFFFELSVCLLCCFTS